MLQCIYYYILLLHILRHITYAITLTDHSPLQDVTSPARVVLRMMCVTPARGPGLCTGARVISSALGNTGQHTPTARLELRSALKGSIFKVCFFLLIYR